MAMDALNVIGPAVVAGAPRPRPTDSNDGRRRKNSKPGLRKKAQSLLSSISS